MTEPCLIKFASSKLSPMSGTQKKLNMFIVFLVTFTDLYVSVSLNLQNGSSCYARII